VDSGDAPWSRRPIDRLAFTAKWVKKLERYLSRNEDSERRVSRLEDLLARQTRRTGPDSIQTTNCRRELAEAIERAGRLQEATALRMEVRDILRRKMDTRNVHYLHEELLIADNLRLLARNDEARKFALHASNVLQETHPNSGLLRSADELLRVLSPKPGVRQESEPTRKGPGMRIIRLGNAPSSRGLYEGTTPTIHLDGKPSNSEG
jgi:hypothetical protein